ncbi:MAG: TolC family protein [Planctomycetaceae bacterium]|nr:TolC family protein [Planctomycetaceae bacterium]
MRMCSFQSAISCALLVGLAGCSGTRDYLAKRGLSRPVAPSACEVSDDGQSDSTSAQRTENSPHLSTNVPRDSADHQVRTVRHELAGGTKESPAEDAALALDGRAYRVQNLEEVFADRELDELTDAKSSPVALPTVESDEWHSHAEQKMSATAIEPDILQLNLPTALSMVGGQHPAVGFAQWRVQEAYARFDRAKVLWLPSIQPGFSFRRHDGNYQASNGSIVDVNLNSFQYGMGAGATGAGTTPRPGIVAQFHLADAIFQPEIAETTAWARGHAANGVVNDQLLEVSVAYLDLLSAEQELRIVEDARDRTSKLAKLTSDFAATGQGLQADADRLQTELILVDNRLSSARERIGVASARLSQALSLDTYQQIVPMDPTVVRIDLVSCDLDSAALISTGLSNRPELKEAQALVAAACEQYKRQKYAPFVPSVLLGFSTGEFGGGLGNSLGNVDGRYDFDALMTWEVRNLGFGEAAARRETHARIEQARYQSVQSMDRIAREISEAHIQVMHRSERIGITQQAILSAEASYERNLTRIRDGQGLPLEVLQSVRALEEARRAYLDAVIEYNEAQFRLQWSLGWPVNAGSTHG